MALQRDQVEVHEVGLVGFVVVGVWLLPRTTGRRAGRARRRRRSRARAARVAAPHAQRVDRDDALRVGGRTVPRSVRSMSLRAGPPPLFPAPPRGSCRLVLRAARRGVAHDEPGLGHGERVRLRRRGSPGGGRAAPVPPPRWCCWRSAPCRRGAPRRPPRPRRRLGRRPRRPRRAHARAKARPELSGPRAAATTSKEGKNGSATCRS